MVINGRTLTSTTIYVLLNVYVRQIIYKLSDKRNEATIDQWIPCT